MGSKSKQYRSAISSGSLAYWLTKAQSTISCRFSTTDSRKASVLRSLHPEPTPQIIKSGSKRRKKAPYPLNENLEVRVPHRSDNIGYVRGAGESSTDLSYSHYSCSPCQ